jgi:predicted metal-binding protein
MASDGLTGQTCPDKILQKEVHFMLYAIGVVVIFLAGGVCSFLVFKNNPKYLNLDKIAKADLQSLADKIKAKL